MNIIAKIKILVVSICTIFFTLGCATTSKIPTERLQRIETVYIESKLSKGITYQRNGLVMSENTDGSKIEEEVIKGLIQQIVSQLELAGYNISEDKDDADVILLVDPVTFAVPYSPIVRGITVHSQTIFGKSLGAKVHLAVCFRVVEKDQEGWIASFCPSPPFQSTEVKSDPERWDLFAEEEKDALIVVLNDLWLSSISDALTSFGFIE